MLIGYLGFDKLRGEICWEYKEPTAFCLRRQRDKEQQLLDFLIPLAMPGVNLDFLPASAAADALNSPESVCAESGLEQMIGDLLAHDEAEDEEEPLYKRKFELMLQCAVSEIHSDLQDFGKRVDARLLEATTQVVPLAEAFAKLQEENTRLRIHQETLVRRVEALCQVMGLSSPSFSSLASKERSPPTQCENIIVSKDFPNLPANVSPCTSESAALEEAYNISSCSKHDSTTSLQPDPPTCTPEATPSSLHQESISCSQENPASSPVPHPPTFASLRSLSAPSLMASTSCKDGTVPFSDTRGFRTLVLPVANRLQFASSNSSCSWLYLLG